MPDHPNGVCPRKLQLLTEYVNLLTAHNMNVGEYSAIAVTGVHDDSTATIKERISESLQEYKDARQRYADHLREHGCDGK